jgi:putative tryptophan/tyrosine transport system substrate-binding protein
LKFRSAVGSAIFRFEAREKFLVKRRDFIALLGGAAAAWPLVARAQQPAIPVIGFLSPVSLDTFADRLRGFRQGLVENGYVEGDNVTIVYRWAENQIDRLPDLAAELVRRPVAVITTVGGAGPALAAKQATKTIPILFITAEDPVRAGLVASLARPDGNATGINLFTLELVAKRLELLRELAPATVRVAVLINPANTAFAETTLRDIEPAARALGLQIQVHRASTSDEIDAVFATFVRARPDALFVGNDPFFTARRVQLAIAAARHSIPAAFGSREIAEAGGLMSYGTNIADGWHQLGAYVGRVLKGTKPAELPVVQSSQFELAINTQTARTLGLTVPPQLLARADEVIE